MVKASIALREALFYTSRIVIPFIVSTYFLAISLGIYIMFLSPEGSSFSEKTVDYLPFGFLTVFVTRIPFTTTYGMVFLLLLIIYTGCLVIAWRKDLNFIEAIRGKALPRSIPARNNLLFIFPALSSSMLIMVVLIQSLQEVSGLPTGAIEFQNIYRGLFELAYSPVFEEFMFRISPFAVYYLVRLGVSRHTGQTRSFRHFLRSLLFMAAFPDSAKQTFGLSNVKKDGVRKGIGLGEWLLTILTSMVFGLAHYLSGSGWEMGKITSSAVAGVAFCLSYLIYGFHAPVLLHWFFNYYFYVYEVAAKKYEGLFEVLESIIGLSVQIVGFGVIMGYSAYLLWRHFHKRHTERGLQTGGGPTIW